MFEVGGLLKNQILFIFLFNTCVLGNGNPLAKFRHRKLEPMSIIPYYFEGSHGPANSLLESLLFHKQQPSCSTVASRVVLGQNLIQEGPGARRRFLLFKLSGNGFILMRIQTHFVCMNTE
ncbi:uncharacterized protein TM35_000971020 [Trypanosoma theileri]|uniref:Uncharacterized protein n=1 Tax=Trypanosoma theileri TaxID=67003 RepID=A0A1X0NE86_9TRYP|nr:uncharacterized protein TM35_000971020 [Trypanosoma theileri]ORC82114.1 hypothetical protein TM35_000971020 [Trypanosoma theileri]